jgi:hypothetical protein
MMRGLHALCHKTIRAVIMPFDFIASIRLVRHLDSMYTFAWVDSYRGGQHDDDQNHRRFRVDRT